MILDEIASNLDIDNEQKIQDSLNKLIQNKTLIIISRHSRAIENIHKIIALAAGKAEHIGTHQELLTKSKTYQKFFQKTQLAEAFSY